MKHLYWVGVNESEIEFCKDLFEKSITINGRNANGNISFSGIHNKRVNYNLDNCEIDDFFSSTLRKICIEDDEANFMFYNPHNAYSCGEEIIKRTICLNKKDLLDMLKSKIESKKYISENTNVNVLPYYVVDSKNLSYEKVCDLFKHSTKEFVVQANHSDGGISTFVINQNNKDELHFNQGNYIITPYIKKSISINTTLIIYDNDIDVFPSSIQIIINESNKLLYKGADFIAYRDLSENIKNQVSAYSLEIAQKLQKEGYRGICGIDFISDSNKVYFMEINERFQASTYLINLALCDKGKNTIQQMCIDAFNHKSLDMKNSNLPIEYSNFAYYKNCSIDKIYDFLDRVKKEKSIFKLVLDGFSKNNKMENNSYLYKLIIKKKISSISPDNKLNICCNLKGLFNLNIDNKLDVKFALLCHGIVVSNEAIEKIIKDGGTCESISRGINITIFEDVTVNCATQNTESVYLSPFELNIKNDVYILTYFGQLVSDVKLQMKHSIMNRYTSKGTPYRAIGFLALDRLGINYNQNCIYQINNIPCGFCSIYHQNCDFTLNEIYEVIDDYLSTVDFDHFLIGGPINDINKDFEKIINISKYISRKSDKNIYLMTLPIDDLNKLKLLKFNGVTEIAFNIEIFDRTLAKKIMPGKGLIPLNKYMNALEKAIKVFGKNGNVRSMVVVGLEPEESLLKGIEKLASIGVTPILSPFGPAKGSKFENMIQPDMDYFKEIYLKAKSICDRYNVDLGPKCNYCKNNTLAMNTY
ncbi:MAG: radical SAM protein [Anaeroplasma sp.]